MLLKLRRKRVYRPTIEERLIKIEDELSSLLIWSEAYEEETDQTVEEIEKRLKNLERFSADGR